MSTDPAQTWKQARAAALLAVLVAYGASALAALVLASPTPTTLFLVLGGLTAVPALLTTLALRWPVARAALPTQPALHPLGMGTRAQLLRWTVLLALGAPVAWWLGPTSEAGQGLGAALIIVWLALELVAAVRAGTPAEQVLDDSSIHFVMFAVLLSRWVISGWAAVGLGAIALGAVLARFTWTSRSLAPARRSGLRLLASWMVLGIGVLVACAVTLVNLPAIQALAAAVALATVATLGVFAVALIPDAIATWRVDRHLARGEYDLALEGADRPLDIRSAAEDRVAILVAAGRIGAAREVFDALLASLQPTPRTHLLRGRLLRAEGDVEASLLAIQQAAWSSPPHLLPAVDLAETLLVLDRPEEALHVLDAAPEPAFLDSAALAGGSSLAAGLRAWALAAAGRREDARVAAGGAAWFDASRLHDTARQHWALAHTWTQLDEPGKARWAAGAGCTDPGLYGEQCRALRDQLPETQPSFQGIRGRQRPTRAGSPP